MIKLGEMQELEVVKKVDFGIYLKSSEDEKGDDRILLPIKQVPENIEIGDKITVFVYRDSNDRVIATVNRPKIVIGEIAVLRVVEMSKIGAFLYWGLEKDLFLPFKEQIGEIKNNGEYMVGLYVDKSDRLCATMNLFNVLRTDSPYHVNDIVNGTVFSLKRGLGATVAVEGKYLGLIHEGEILKPLRSGDAVEVRVSNIKEDGKLDLSLKDAPKLQIDRDGDKIFNALAKNKGSLPLNDKSNPQLIIDKLGMSKGSFKKGVGRLMKRGILEITRDGIKLTDKNNKNDSRDYRDDDDSDQRDYRNNNNSDKKDHRNNSTDKRDYRNSSSDKKDYRTNSNTDKKDYRTSGSSDKKDYRTSSSTDKKDYRSSNTDKKDYRTNSSTDKKDYRTNSNTDKKDYRTNSSTDKKDYRTNSSTDKKDYRTSSTDKKDYRTSSTDKKNYRTSSTGKKDYRKNSNAETKFANSKIIKNDKKK